MNILISLLITFNLLASEEIVKPSENLPLELQLIIGEIRLNQGDVKSSRVRDFLQVADLNLQKMAADDRLFFIKSQVYKELINNPPSNFENEMSIDISLIKDFDSMVKAEKLSNPVAQWLRTSLINDLKRMLENPNFSRAILNKERGRALNDLEQREYNKVELILPWMRMLHFADEENVQEKVSSFSFNVLERLSLSTHQFNKISSLEEHYIDLEAPLSFFEIITPEEIEKQQEASRIERIVQRILDNAESLPEPTDDWMPSEDNEVTRSNFSQEKDPNYVIPDYLPKPVNDWIEDL